jgi:nitrite reductase/ring-hydroxylating ferredoxin subunit
MTAFDDPDYVRAAAVADVEVGRGTIVRVGRYEVALFNLGDAIVGYENACPHQGGPIGEGTVEGMTVTCPWHAWCFDLRSGYLTIGNFAQLRRFDVRVEGNAIFVAREPAEDAA